MNERKIIYLDDAIEAIHEYKTNTDLHYRENHQLVTVDYVEKKLLAVPSAQSEIIRCKDCKYRDENWRRVSVRWLPCMDVRTGSNWYCGSAERGEQDGRINSIN